MSLIADIHNDIENGAIRLITEYQARLFSDAIKICGNSADAEDLVNRTFVKAINSLSQHKPEKNFYGWMKAILVNLHRDDLDRPVTRGTMPVEDGALEQYAGADWSTDEEILRNSDCEVLREVLQRMDPKERDILLMRYYDGFSLKEIANVLNMPVSTVGRRIHLAMRLLAGKLGTKMGKAKKPLAVLGVLLLGAATLFGAYQTGLIDTLIERWNGSADATPVVGADVLDGPQSSDNASDERFDLTQETQTQKNTLQQTHKTQTQEKRTMKLTQTFAAAALAVTAAVVTVEADGITLESVSAKQRYPWNGLVDIDYTITYDNDATIDVDDNLEVMLVDHDVEPAVTNHAITFLQAPLPLTEGSHRITWDANADGVTNRIEKAEFVIQLKHYSEAYMVIDVSGGSATNCYPVDFLNGVPLNGFNGDEYKGDKIVLRRIHPGSYMAGSPANEANHSSYATREKQHRVAISQPFYVGIFEITQQQYQNVMGGSNPSTHQGDKWQHRPVETISWVTVRGGTWPNGKPGAGSFMDKLIQKCKAKDPLTGVYTNKVEGFDLPTEYQWEYACRAGTTGAFNTTNEIVNTTAGQKAALDGLGRYVDNQSAGKGGITTAHTIVGSYLPNAWGLYDMHGNVWEWCRDRYIEDPTTLNPKQYKDPVGADSGSSRVMRGGSWGLAAGSCRSAYRDGPGETGTSANGGFRLFRTLP